MIDNRNERRAKPARFNDRYSAWRWEPECCLFGPGGAPR